MTDHDPLASIEALHHSIPIYPSWIDCADDDHGDPAEEFCRDCDPEFHACETCRDEDGSWIDWPCETGTALAEAREAVDGLVAERDRLREALMFAQTPRVRIIDDLLDALGLDDSVTEDEARERLDGCDCNGEEGTRHLVWHLVQQRDRLRETLGRVEALATQPNDQVECPYDDVREEAMWRVGHVAAMHSILTALVQPATDEEAGQ